MATHLSEMRASLQMNLKDVIVAVIWTFLFVSCRTEGDTQRKMEGLRGPTVRQVVAPKLIEAIRPGYPQGLADSGTAGKVVLSFDVLQNGRVANVSVKSSTDFRFNQSATNAILRFRFEPAKQNGRPVDYGMQMPISFYPHHSKITGSDL